MQHFASSSFNGSRITISKGDSLTVVLRYTPRQTAWSFGDCFAFGPSLVLGTMEVKDGVRTMEFTARQEGTVEIALDEAYVLGIQGPSNIKSTFKLSVTVI